MTGRVLKLSHTVARRDSMYDEDEKIELSSPLIIIVFNNFCVLY